MIVFTIFLSSFSFYTYQLIYSPNLLIDQPDRYLPISKNTTFKDLQNVLYDEDIVNDLVAFSFLARIKKYDLNIKPGMYLLKSNMNNRDALNLLKSGSQVPIDITFNGVRKLDELPGIVGPQVDFDSTDLAEFLGNKDLAMKYEFDSLSFISMFIPNTYEVYWTLSPEDFVKRMNREYKRFWNEDRMNQARELGLSPLEVSILASIVEKEVSKIEELPIVAGLYINRLKRNIHLQADPTLVFASGDFGIHRVLNKHKEIDSPYNTYKYRGLPPGPICMPEISSIDAVLNYKKHNFLYMCAKDDFSGYHVFARTLREHNINAAKFQRALNRERIYR